MAPVRVRGCAGTPKPPGTPGVSSGKPMPGAGETAHVRRLFVDRSRCALEVSPAPLRVPMSLMTGRRAVVAFKSGDTLSRRMWGRRPGRPDGWHADAGGFVVSGVDAPGVRAPARSPRVFGTRHGRLGDHPDSALTGHDDLHHDPFRGLRTPFSLRLRHRSPLVSVGTGPNTTTVLIHGSSAPSNHVPGSGDDRVPDGYTHFQTSRVRLEPTEGRGTARHTSPR